MASHGSGLLNYLTSLIKADLTSFVYSLLMGHRTSILRTLPICPAARLRIG